VERLSPRRQGDLGELSAIEWLGAQGYAVWVPIGHSPDCDLIADDGTTLLRVQAKTTTRYRNRRWEVMLSTRGGNQSWNGIVKRFSAERSRSALRARRRRATVVHPSRPGIREHSGVPWRPEVCRVRGRSGPTFGIKLEPDR
jgi:hypothetical protein